MNLIGYQDRYPRQHPDAVIMEGAWVIGEVTLGAWVSVWFGAVLRADIAPISIGEGSNIQDNAVVHVDFDTPTTIGARVTVGHGAILHGCTIEDECLIGMGATILNGAKVGRGSMVGANALVPPGTQIPPGSLVVGLPAKVIRPLKPEEIAGIVESAKHYVEFARGYEKYKFA